MGLTSYMLMKASVKWLSRKAWFFRLFLDCSIIKDWRSSKSGPSVLAGIESRSSKEMSPLKADKLLLETVDRLGWPWRLKSKVLLLAFWGPSSVTEDQPLPGVDGTLTELKYT